MVYNAKDVGSAVEVAVTELSGISGVTRKVTGVLPEMADKLVCRCWLNQDKIAEFNTAQSCKTYGSATVFNCYTPLNIDLREGDTFKMAYYNGTGGALTAVEAVICFEES